MTDWVKILKKIPEAWTIPSRRSVQELIDDDKPGKALIIANLKVKNWPKNPDVWGDKGDVLNELGRFREAIVAYKKAFKLDPKNDANKLGLILACHDTGDFNEAIKWIDKLSEDKFTKDVVILRADCLSHLGKHSQSLKIFRNLLEDDPGDPDLIDACAIILIDLKRYKEADKLVDKLIELDPESANNLNMKSDIAVQTGKFKVAIKFAQKALKLVGEDDDYAISWSNIASAQFAQKNYKAAEKSIEKSLEFEDEDGTGWLILSWIKKALGKDFEFEAYAGFSRMDKESLVNEVLRLQEILPVKERKEFLKQMRDL